MMLNVHKINGEIIIQAVFYLTEVHRRHHAIAVASVYLSVGTGL